MKVSELIEKLQSHFNEYGDVEVVLTEADCFVSEIFAVDFDQLEEEIDIVASPR